MRAAPWPATLPFRRLCPAQPIAQPFCGHSRRRLCRAARAADQAVPARRLPASVDYEDFAGHIVAPGAAPQPGYRTTPSPRRAWPLHLRPPGKGKYSLLHTPYLKRGARTSARPAAASPGPALSHATTTARRGLPNLVNSPGGNLSFPRNHPEEIRRNIEDAPCSRWREPCAPCPDSGLRPM